MRCKKGVDRDMIKSVEHILKTMGFEEFMGGLMANIEEDATGDVLTAIAKTSEDHRGLRIWEIHLFDKQGNYLDKYSIDQIIEALRRTMRIIPLKPQHDYIITCEIQVNVPVRACEIPHTLYVEKVRDSNAHNATLEAAKDIASMKLRNQFANSDINIIKYTINLTHKRIK